jgi:hypothetical protein
MKDTNFGNLLFFERLDDVRSFSIEIVISGPWSWPNSTKVMFFIALSQFGRGEHKRSRRFRGSAIIPRWNL